MTLQEILPYITDILKHQITYIEAEIKYLKRVDEPDEGLLNIESEIKQIRQNLEFLENDLYNQILKNELDNKNPIR